ncbi:hypothetical protein BGX38DRAFT_1141139 [Terfezia claveryi]|nr:hypothetical protein BGX38DRAFT_1141139 [Terfezia claveryi]
MYGGEWSCAGSSTVAEALQALLRLHCRFIIQNHIVKTSFFVMDDPLYSRSLLSLTMFHSDVSQESCYPSGISKVFFLNGGWSMSETDVYPAGFISVVDNSRAMTLFCRSKNQYTMGIVWVEKKGNGRNVERMNIVIRVRVCKVSEWRNGLIMRFPVSVREGDPETSPNGCRSWWKRRNVVDPKRADKGH